MFIYDSQLSKISPIFVEKQAFRRPNSVGDEIYDLYLPGVHITLEALEVNVTVSETTDLANSNDVRWNEGINLF